MKKILCFVAMFAITLTSFAGFTACSGHDELEKIVLIYNNTTYQSGQNFNYVYGDEIDINKDTVKFVGITNSDVKNTFTRAGMTCTYEYAEIGSSNFVGLPEVFFFEKESTTASSGMYKFTFSKEGINLVFTVTVAKASVIDNCTVQIKNDGEVIEAGDTGAIEWINGDSISYDIAGITDEQKQQLGSPMLLMLSKEQYEACSSPADYNGEMFVLSNLDAGEYYIYAQYDSSDNYNGGNTSAIYCIVH